MTPGMWITVAIVAQVSFQEGVAHFREGRLPEAERAFLSSLSETPNHAPSSVFLARVYVQMGRLDDAEHALERGLTHHPTGVGLLNELGSLDLARGRLDEAEDAFRRALESQPSNERAILGLGEALAESGRLVEAHAHFARFSDKPRVERARGLVAYALNRDEEALTLLSRSVEREPSDARSMLTIGQIHLRRGELRLARESFEKAVAASPENAESHFYLGEMLLGVVELQAALSEYERALELDPAHLRAHHRLAEVLSKLGRGEEAIGVLTNALQLPSAPRARAQTYYLIATAHARNDEEALEALDEARALNPHDAKIRYLMGTVLARLGRSEQSRAELEVFRDLESFDERAEKLELALIERPDEAAPYLALIELYLAHDRIDEALVYLEKAIALGSDDTEDLIELKKKLEVSR